MRISFIATVLNEENTILSLLKSLESQTLKPTEVIITDGGSVDHTPQLIQEFQKESKLKIKFIEAKGNRSIGRNTAIEHATAEIIAISDAGCTLDKNWLKEIIKPFEDKTTDVVAGYYQGKAKTPFQEALIPYVLVMNPDPNNFLPATRSMAMRRKVWEGTGGFDKRLSNNEDYAFSRKLKKNNYKIYFSKKAIVFWTSRENLGDAFNMFYRFAKGDSESGIIRPKVLLIFARYFISGVLLILSFQNHKFLYLFLILIMGYIAWAILKNYKYVKIRSAISYFPLIQFTSDIAVMIGTIIGKI